MRDYAAINRKWWNEVTPIHKDSKLYDLAGFKKGKTSLQTIELEEVGDVRGKTMLHLMCHFGMDTLSWAREGAVVTGVDLSDTSIRLARKLGRELHIPGKFVCSDIYDLPSVLDEQFDIIIMSYGVLLWLSSLKKWAKLIHQYLKPGGFFYIVELHPFTNILSDNLSMYYDYFDKGPYVEEEEGTYSDWQADIKGETYIWLHSLGDVVNPLLKQGLQLEYIHEFPFTMYEQFPGLMRQNEKGQYVLKDTSIAIPLLFSLKATKA